MSQILNKEWVNGDRIQIFVWNIFLDTNVTDFPPTEDCYFVLVIVPESWTSILNQRWTTIKRGSFPSSLEGLQMLNLSSSVQNTRPRLFCFIRSSQKLTGLGSVLRSLFPSLWPQRLIGLKTEPQIHLYHKQRAFTWRFIVLLKPDIQYSFILSHKWSNFLRNKKKNSIQKKKQQQLRPPNWMITFKLPKLYY